EKRFSIDSYGGNPGGAPQLGSSTLVDTLVNSRILSAARYELDDGADILLCNTVGGDSGHGIVYWYNVRLDIRGPIVEHWGFIDGGPGVWSYQPAIGMNTADEVCIVFTRSSASTYPTMYYAVYQPSSQSFSTPMPLKVSGGPVTGATYSNGDFRWGDFAVVCADPSDNSFWVADEFAINGES